MTRTKTLSLAYSSLFICSAFILCAGLGMLINPDAFHKFFSPIQLVPDVTIPLPHKSYYWDVKHYAEMVLSNRCVAFYPLWPWVIRLLFRPQNLEQAAHLLLVTSTIISFVLIPFLLGIFIKELRQPYLSFILVLAYFLNPMSIFRVIGYTESLFSALSAIFIWLCLRQTELNETIRLFLVFLIIGLMSLTRPILIQCIFSSIAALATILLFENLKMKGGDFRSQINKYTKEINTTVTLCISSLLGYSIYGIFCLRSRGDFFAPFNDQKLWGMRPGLHLEFFLFPKSPLFDLLGFYFSLLVLFGGFTFVYFKTKNKIPLVWIPKSPLWNALILYPPLLVLSYVFNYFRLKKNAADVNNRLTQLVTSDYTKTLSSNYVFWFCVYFSVAHSIIVFFTRDRLYSLGRFIFGTPFFFLALGYLCCCIPGKKTYQMLWWFVLISAIALVEQWVNYGKNSWLG